MFSKRRRFTPEFRAKAVRLVTGTDRPVAHVAADRALDVDERAELERLRKKC